MVAKAEKTGGGGGGESPAAAVASSHQSRRRTSFIKPSWLLCTIAGNTHTWFILHYSLISISIFNPPYYVQIPKKELQIYLVV